MSLVQNMGPRCRVIVRTMQTSATRASEAKTAVQEFGARYLGKQEALKRPMSPHLSIYKPQLTWLLSGAHRFVGCLMGGTVLVGGIGFALLPIRYDQLIEKIRSWNLPAPVTGAFKFFIVYNMAFYALNGVRMLGFDMAKGTDLVSVYRSGWLVLGLAVLISLFVVLNSGKKERK